MPDRMPLERKAARLFWITVHGSAADAPHPGNQRAFGLETPAEVIRRFRPGGVALFAWSGNTEHPVQVAQLTHDLRAVAAEGGDAPLAIAIDEEGGRVTRLGPPATPFPSARAVAAASAAQPDLALQRWRAGATELAAVGVTTDLAPVVDLANPWNPVLGDRAFAEDPATVARHAALAVRGLAEGGITAVAKHFPGHGATTVDSHAALPVVELTPAQLAPHIDAFRQLLAAQAPAGIMPGHLLVRALDPERPATLSPAILETLLRDELGYGGAVVTDSLSMAGIRGGAPDPEVAVAALAAGADVLLMPPDLPGAIAAVCRAVRSGAISEERLDSALRRGQGLVLAPRSATDPAGSTAARGVGSDAHRQVVTAIARHALRIEEADAAALPLGDQPLVVVGVTGAGARGLVDALGRRGRDATLVEIPVRDPGAARLAAAGQADTGMDAPAPGALPDLTAAIGGLDGTALVLVRRAPELDAALQDDLLAPLARRSAPVALVETGGTAAGWWDPTGTTRLRTFDASLPALEAAAQVLVGDSGAEHLRG